MKWSDLIRLAATNLWRRKLRSVLTMIGVMIGTASIVVMVSIGIGINHPSAKPNFRNLYAIC